MLYVTPELINNLSVIDDGYNYNRHVNNGAIFDNERSHYSRYPYDNIHAPSHVTTVQPPPYSVAISSSSYPTSSSPTPNTVIYTASGGTGGRQVPLDVIQGSSVYRANEFDTPFNKNDGHRRTSMPVSSFPTSSDISTNDLLGKTTGQRINRPDVLSLRNIERQLSLPVKSVDISSDYHQSRRIRRNFGPSDSGGGAGAGDNIDIENYSGDRSRPNSSGALIDDEDGDNECGDDELSEYGAYPPPEPAPPDFIPSSDADAFLSPSVQVTNTRALGGHSSTSSIEGTCFTFSYLLSLSLFTRLSPSSLSLLPSHHLRHC